MATISKILRSINNYPIPDGVIMESAVRHGLNPDDEATEGTLSGEAYELAKADVYAYLAAAPNVTQNGVSFSFTSDQRSYFLSLSNSLRDKWDYFDPGSGQGYGYMGEDY